jgi:hypothetical protein
MDAVSSRLRDELRTREIQALRDKRLEVWRTLKNTLDSFQARASAVPSNELSTYKNVYEYLEYLDKQITMLHSIPPHRMGAVEVTALGSAEPEYIPTYPSALTDTDCVPSGLHPPLCADPAWNARYFGGSTRTTGAKPLDSWEARTYQEVYGSPVIDGPHVRYRKLIIEREHMIKALCSDLKYGRPEAPGLNDAITQADNEIEQLCEQLGYEYLQWTCVWSEYTGPEIRYEPTPPKPREIVDELFTEITGLNPEDTYAGWREAFMETGLMSALEHMREHVR